MDSVYDFWVSNPSYWICNSKNRQHADENISRTFSKMINNSYPLTTQKHWIGYIIFLDQFSRHFQRYMDDFTETQVEENRKFAVELAERFLESFGLARLSDKELYFILMPLKHLNKYELVFEYVKIWEETNQVTQFIQRFYTDTVEKYYKTINYKDFTKSIMYESVYYKPSNICEFYSDGFRTLKNKELPFMIPNITNPIVSLSGGVDSMVLLALYKLNGSEPRAVHIGYGNRPEADEEFELIKDYCFSLDVPLYYFPIKYAKRGHIDREVYEEITRFIRFSVYRSLSNTQEPSNIILGHIRDDVVENIWTNFANDRHLDNLKKMESVSLIDGVMIHRPLLDKSKSDILAISQDWGIPYTKNTTPEWSNRGKFRNHFYAASIKQYGDSVDERIIRVAQKLQRQAELVNKLLYQPILNSWDGYKFILNNTILELENEEWINLIKMMFRKACSLEPSRKSCLNFIERFKHNPNKKIETPMTRNYTMICYNNEIIITKTNV